MVLSSPPLPSFFVPETSTVRVKGKQRAIDNDIVNDGGDGDNDDDGDGDGEKAVKVKGESMYVRLFDEMIMTVLDGESYLFSASEEWVLRYIRSLTYEARYILTRLLLRRPGRVHTQAALVGAYAGEVGEEGVRRGMEVLVRGLEVPPDEKGVGGEEGGVDELAEGGAPRLSPPPRPRSTPKQERPTQTRAASQDSKPRKTKTFRKKPWSGLPSGLTTEEEQADPGLAEALRESLWASRVGVVVLGDTEDEDDGERKEIGDKLLVGTRQSPRSTPLPAPALVPEFTLRPTPLPPLTHLAHPHASLTLDDLLSVPTLEELRRLGKGKVGSAVLGGGKEGIVKALKGMARGQMVLAFPSTPGPSTPGKPDGQKTLSFAPKPGQESRSKTVESRLVSDLLALFSGSALRLDPSLYALVARVSLIFTRTPPGPGASGGLMLPSILVTSHKRAYPEYSVHRTRIWTTREELLVYEKSVQWETLVSDALGENWEQHRAGAGTGAGGGWMGRKEGAGVVRKVWEGVWPVWKGMVQGDRGVQGEGEGGAGDRFRTEHVLTRIVYKGAEALGILHEYDLECTVLRALLAQRRWRRGKRGAWYDRLALVLMTHYNDSAWTAEEREEKLREATQVCIDALLDDDTHLVYRPGLSRRLTRLEKKLDLPADERHISYASLEKCETREVVGVRLPENRGQVRSRSASASARERERSMSLFAGGEEEGGVGEKGGGWRQRMVGKSLWMGKEGEVGVEEWVLEWWAEKGYKGYHSESSILTTLFTLLLWPVLFHPVPGAFETPYQTTPLDLGSSSFPLSRHTILSTHLNLIAHTPTALSLLREADDRERPRGTWAVGVNWEYPRTDLEELAECIGGRGLSGIARVLAEDYGYRASGVPDLVVWSREKKEVRFVEVKGPGDSLSETQKIWIDVLLSLGIPVEVCRVKAINPTAAQLESFNNKRKSTSFAGSVAGYPGLKRAKRGEDSV